MRRFILGATMGLAACWAIATPQSPRAEQGQPAATMPTAQRTGKFADPMHFRESGGAAIYRSVCKGCHMPNGAGAVGAGTYPALENDPKLESAGYVLTVVLRGQRTMPSFTDYFSDQQVADIVNYVRSRFGKDNEDPVSPQDVAAAR